MRDERRERVCVCGVCVRECVCPVVLLEESPEGCWIGVSAGMVMTQDSGWASGTQWSVCSVLGAD